jgi:hypothetical protein
MARLSQLTFTSICSGLVFSCLDTSIVSTALVSVSSEFQNYQDTPWIVLGYLLTYMSECLRATHTSAPGRADLELDSQASPLASPSLATSTGARILWPWRGCCSHWVPCGAALRGAWGNCTLSLSFPPWLELVVTDWTTTASRAVPYREWGVRGSTAWPKSVFLSKGPVGPRWWAPWLEWPSRCHSSWGHCLGVPYRNGTGGASFGSSWCWPSQPLAYRH